MCSSRWFKPLHGKRLDRAAKLHSAFAAVDISLSDTYVQQPIKTNCSEGFTKNAGGNINSTTLPDPEFNRSSSLKRSSWPALVQSLRTMVWVSAFSRMEMGHQGHYPFVERLGFAFPNFSSLIRRWSHTISHHFLKHNVLLISRVSFRVSLFGILSCLSKQGYSPKSNGISSFSQCSETENGRIHVYPRLEDTPIVSPWYIFGL